MGTLAGRLAVFKVNEPEPGGARSGH
jgi:hypothetical protein